MNAPRAKTWLTHVAALLAVALLSMAGVRSIVMRAAEAAPASSMATCSGMAGMAALMERSDHHPGKAHKVCEFCSAAAHAPICSSTTPILAQLTVRYVSWRSPGTLGARGPPTITAKARGPPASLLTA